MGDIEIWVEWGCRREETNCGRGKKLSMIMGTLLTIFLSVFDSGIEIVGISSTAGEVRERRTRFSISPALKIRVVKQPIKPSIVSTNHNSDKHSRLPISSRNLSASQMSGLSPPKSRTGPVGFPSCSTNSPRTFAISSKSCAWSQE